MSEHLHRGPAAVRTGTLLGVCSALCYTLANTALRDVSRPGQFDWSLWVTLTKAVPVAAIAWVAVGLRAAGGQPALPPWRIVPRLAVAGLIAQLGGNLLFQVSLGMIGLALTVPVCFTGIILTGAGLGWLVLGEPVGWTRAASIALLIAADAALALAAPDAALNIADTADPLFVAGGVSISLAAGCSYGLLGVVIRKTAADGVGVAGTLAPIGAVGVLALLALLLARTGGVPWGETDGATWLRLGAAGAANAAAFFAIAAALRRIDVVRVNLLNASQAAMCGAVGVLVFAEPPTVWLLVGTGLTIAGLGLLGVRGPKGDPRS